MRRRRRIFNPHPIVLKDKVSNIIARPFGVEIRGEFINRDRVKNIIRSVEDGEDFAVYYIRKLMVGE